MTTANRRQMLGFGGAALGLIMIGDWAPALAKARGAFPLAMTEAQWRIRLSPDAYAVLRQAGTERPGSSPLDREHRRGIFHCAGCDQRLFSSTAKFDSRTGWPSFFQPLARAISTSVDRSHGAARTEVHCSRCGGHLGHVFKDGPPPTGLRYCMNGVAMRFRAA